MDIKKVGQIMQIKEKKDAKNAYNDERITPCEPKIQDIVNRAKARQEAFSQRERIKEENSSL